MKVLILLGVLRCGHDGKVKNVNSQEWVRIATEPALVATDPEGREISMCPNISTNTKQCNHTLVVITGYSDFIRIDGKKLCLDSINGMTDGVPPSHYTVRDPGQQFVGADR